MERTHFKNKSGDNFKKVLNMKVKENTQQGNQEHDGNNR
jgi:hypothetical protein